eukprot:1286555-Amphidinium_carterae.1
MGKITNLSHSLSMGSGVSVGTASGKTLAVTGFQSCRMNRPGRSFELAPRNHLSLSICEVDEIPKLARTFHAMASQILTVTPQS